MMDSTKAFDVVNQACAAYRGTREEHRVITEALLVLKKCVAHWPDEDKTSLEVIEEPNEE